MEPTQPTPENEVALPPAVSPEQKPKLSIPAAIIIGALMICVSIFVSNAVHLSFTPSAGNGTAATAGAPAVVDAKNVVTAGEPFIGNANAPTIAYFSDYQCPFCKEFETTVLPTLKTEDVDTGKFKIVFKDFVFLGPDSQTAALFARAVWALYPNQYFAWREAMFNAQDAENNGFGNRASIEQLTRGIPGIDQVKVSAAVDANSVAYQKAIDADYAEGQKFGIQGTPSVIVGQSLIQGYNPLATYTAAISKVSQ